MMLFRLVGKNAAIGLCIITISTRAERAHYMRRFRTWGISLVARPLAVYETTGLQVERALTRRSLDRSRVQIHNEARIVFDLT